MVAESPGPMPEILRASERKSVPWKNGGGVTSEIAAFPQGSGIDDFGWRISTALVTAAGPFSLFEGVDRFLTVLEGRLLLRIDAADSEVTLDPGQSYSFAGDIAVTGGPLGGPVRDLNVMVRRSDWQAAVTTHRPHLSENAILIAIASQPGSGLAMLDAVQLDGDYQLAADFTGYFIAIRPMAES